MVLRPSSIQSQAAVTVCTPGTDDSLASMFIEIVPLDGSPCTSKLLLTLSGPWIEKTAT